MLTKYIHAGNLTAYLDMELIENKSSPTAGYALLKLHRIINEHPDYFGCITLGECTGAGGTAGTRNVRAAGETRV